MRASGTREKEVHTTEALALIGVTFLIFSLIAIDVWRRQGDAAGREASLAVIQASWVLIGFGVVSWLFSVVFVGAGKAIASGWESLGLPLWLLFVAPFVVVYLLGVVARRGRQRVSKKPAAPEKPTAPPRHHNGFNDVV